MAKKHYDWANGPAELDAHSLTKHSVLVDYLLRYFEQRTLNARGREVFKVTLIDGFCGGGLYRLKTSNDEVLGSPLRMLDAVQAAQVLVNQGRTKPVELQVQYIFVDQDKTATHHLEGVLKQRGYGGQIGNSIHLITSNFGQASDQVLNLVQKHTPRSAKALFFLDQYGYSDVPAPLIRKILVGLPNSEVVLTFHVASFATYTNDDFTNRIEETLQIDIRSCLGGQSIEAIKGNEADWRRFIQGALYQALVADCGARFFTPFFIRGEGSGHGEYWLVHLSQHHRAQDVMKQVHWQHQNHFIHYGGAGLNMLAPHTMGFMQEFNGGFRFDDVARHESDAALRKQLAERIYALDAPKSFGDLFASSCNESPATAGMYKDALAALVQERDILVTSTDDKAKRHARYMTDTDIIQRNTQIKLFV